MYLKIIMEDSTLLSHKSQHKALLTSSFGGFFKHNTGTTPRAMNASGHRGALLSRDEAAETLKYS